MSGLFQPGEFVDITIRGARVMPAKPGINNVLTLAYEEVEPGVFATVELRHPRAGSVTIQRVAPAEWPPRRGDVWQDRHTGRWFAAEHDGGIIMHGDGGTSVSPARLIDEVAPLTLAYRTGDGTR